MRRIIVAVVVGLGLFAMHGLAAPSAQAAHCGGPPGHVHLDVAPPPTEAASAVLTEASFITSPESGGEHGMWLACVAILVGLALVAAVRRVGTRLEPMAGSAADHSARTRPSRSPPQSRPEDLCVWRT